MRRRVALAALLLACTGGAAQAPHDAGASPPDVSQPADIQLGIQGIDDQFYVVRGESASIPFVLAGKDAARAGAVAAVGLAPGLSADPTFVSGPTSGVVTVHADADAPPSNLGAELVTQLGGVAKFKIAVVGVDGSLDPSFGAGGLLQLPEMTGVFVDIARTPSGAFLVAGGEVTGSMGSVRVLRLLEDGSLDSSFGAGGVVLAGAKEGVDGSTGGALAVCDDGTFVVTAEDSLGADGEYQTEYRAFYFDASGAETDDVILPTQSWPSGLACVGGSLVLSAYEQLVVVDAAHVVHAQPLPPNDFPAPLAAASSDLYVAASDLLAFVPDAPAHYAPDAAFGNQGVVALPQFATALALDDASNVLIAGGAPTSVLRFLPGGALDPSFGQNGMAPLPLEANAAIAAVAVGPTSNDTFAIAAGVASFGIEIARLDASGAPVQTFGLGGAAFTRTDVEPLPQRAIFDASGGLWVAARSEQGGAFIARYRVVDP